MVTEFTPGLLNDISIIERVGSVLSIIGGVFIIVTFSVSSAFHKPINRLVFYASFGNMMSNVGSLMSREYVDQIDSFGCQFQGFLIQMFLPADALWTLAMAFNVYLTFYYKFDANRLRKMEIWYMLLCYGVPLVPALTYVFVYNKEAGRMYGNAVLWCWVSSGWDIFRIATFYGPVWMVILLTFFIYLRAGRDIYRKRKQLHNFGSSGTHDADLWMFEDPLAVKTTEVSVTSETIGQGQQGIDLAPLGRSDSTSCVEAGQNAAYSVTISSSKKGDRRSQGPPPTAIRDAQPSSSIRPRPKTKKRANYEANNAAWSYTKCALLFFTALLVTWVPSSANRVYSVIHVNETSVPLEIISAVVLPLQGFWNAIIYIVTSWSAVKLFFTDLGRHTRRRPVSTNYPSDINDKRNFAFKLSSRNDNANYESESMTELAITTERPSSNEETKQ
ncbi:hypothetical protein F5X96DRAFT_272010 [Biscogniauxia mediterranea]|nr:hypothetical protein F5X96DRAFT_272010 [Biscogniauxia mediterranea]